MAGTVTISEVTHRTMKLVHFTFVSSTGGAADGTTTEFYSGKIAMLVTDPSTTAPTASWDVAVNDSNGLDVLAGSGADQSATAITYTAGSSSTPLSAVTESKLTLAVTNAGDAKGGEVFVFIR